MKAIVNYVILAAALAGTFWTVGRERKWFGWSKLGHDDQISLTLLLSWAAIWYAAYIAATTG